MGPQGYPGLRQFVADKLRAAAWHEGAIDDVTIITGSGQGLDMISKLLLNPGDTVLSEEFCYQGAMNRFRRLGAKLVGDEARRGRHRHRCAGGATGGAEGARASRRNSSTRSRPFKIRRRAFCRWTAAHALLKLAREYNVAIFEDECYADLLWDGVEAPPALYALDPGCVIHLGSFSKSLAPALRLGYVVADGRSCAGCCR